MFDFGEMFKGAFGKLEPGKCKLTVDGRIAVKCHDGYKSYNLKTKRLVNNHNFGFSADNFFFVIPTSSVKAGDIILADGKPKCVINAPNGGSEYIEVIDYESSEIRKILPVRHLFMGAAFYYGKIVSVFGNMMKSGKGLNKIMTMAAMSSMFSSGDSKSMFPTASGQSQMPFDPSMFMMMSMFGGGENPFESMFEDMDLDFSGLNTNEEDEDEAEGDEEMDEIPDPAPAPKKTTSKKKGTK